MESVQTHCILQSSIVERRIFQWPGLQASHGNSFVVFGSACLHKWWFRYHALLIIDSRYLHRGISKSDRKW